MEYLFEWCNNKSDWLSLIYCGILLANPLFDKIFIKKMIDIRHSNKVSIVMKIV